MIYLIKVRLRVRGAVGIVWIELFTLWTNKSLSRNEIVLSWLDTFNEIYEFFSLEIVKEVQWIDVYKPLLSIGSGDGRQ